MFQRDDVGIFHRAFVDGWVKVPQCLVGHFEVGHKTGVVLIAAADHGLRVKHQYASACAHHHPSVLEAYRGVVFQFYLRPAREFVVALDVFRTVLFACKSCFGAYPQVVVAVFYDRGNHVASLSLIDRVGCEHGLPFLGIISRQSVEPVANDAHPYIPPMVFVEGVDVVFRNVCAHLFPVDFKADILCFVKVAVERHKSVCGAHPQSAVAVFGDGSHIVV